MGDYLAPELEIKRKQKKREQLSKDMLLTPGSASVEKPEENIFLKPRKHA